MPEINTPEGSCVTEEFCCNEFVAALLENVCIGLSATCDLSWCVCCSSDSHLQVMVFKVLEDCLKLSCGIIVAALR